MKYEWDENKNKTNRIKHGVSFETAQRVFEDPYLLRQQDLHETGEQRWQSLGLIDEVVILFVAHTYRIHQNVEVTRIISARKATKRERESYEQSYKTTSR